MAIEVAVMTMTMAVTTTPLSLDMAHTMNMIRDTPRIILALATTMTGTMVVDTMIIGTETETETETEIGTETETGTETDRVPVVLEEEEEGCMIALADSPLPPLVPSCLLLTEVRREGEGEMEGERERGSGLCTALHCTVCMWLSPSLSTLCVPCRVHSIYSLCTLYMTNVPYI